MKCAREPWPGRLPVDVFLKAVDIVEDEVAASLKKRVLPPTAP